MALTRLSNQSLTSLTALPAAIATGKVLQVVSVTWDDATSSSSNGGTYAAITGASASITPSATSSKIFFQAMITTGTHTYATYIKIQRGGSDIAGALGAVSGSRKAMTGYSQGGTADDAEMQSTYISYLDSPSSTSSLTYTLLGSARHSSAGGWTVNYPETDTDATYTGHSVSTITLMEIGA